MRSLPRVTAKMASVWVAVHIIPRRDNQVRLEQNGAITAATTVAVVCHHVDFVMIIKLEKIHSLENIGLIRRETIKHDRA